MTSGGLKHGAAQSRPPCPGPHLSGTKRRDGRTDGAHRGHQDREKRPGPAMPTSTPPGRTTGAPNSCSISSRRRTRWAFTRIKKVVATSGAAWAQDTSFICASSRSSRTFGQTPRAARDILDILAFLASSNCRAWTTPGRDGHALSSRYRKDGVSIPCSRCREAPNPLRTDECCVKRSVVHIAALGRARAGRSPLTVRNSWNGTWHPCARSTFSRGLYSRGLMLNSCRSKV